MVTIMLAIALHLVEPGESASIVGRTEDLQPLVLPGRGLLRGTPVARMSDRYADRWRY